MLPRESCKQVCTCLSLGMDIRDKILQAAAAVYAESGFRGATTRRIAMVADVNEVSIFRHFGSKAALLHEAVQAAGLFPQVPELPQTPCNPLVELTAWAKAHHAQLVAKRSLIRTCLGECEEHPDILPPGDSSSHRTQQALSEYLQRLSRSGIIASHHDLRTATEMLTGVLFADAMGRDIMPGLFHASEDETIKNYVSILLSALGLEQPTATLSDKAVR